MTYFSIKFLKIAVSIDTAYWSSVTSCWRRGCFISRHVSASFPAVSQVSFPIAAVSPRKSSSPKGRLVSLLVDVLLPGGVAVFLRCCCFLGGLLPNCAGILTSVYRIERNQEAGVRCADALVAEIAQKCCSDLHTVDELTDKSLRLGLQQIPSFVTFNCFLFEHFLKYFPWLGGCRWRWRQERGREKNRHKG